MRTVAQVAEQWGVHVSLVYRWIEQGRLSVTRVGSIILVSNRAKRPTPRRGGFRATVRRTV